MGINIICGRIWGISKNRLCKALRIGLGDCYSENTPNIFFDITNQPIMSDKIFMNKKLDELGIYHPKTYYYPFDDLPDTKEECVIKHRYGSMGNHLEFTKFKKVDKNTLYGRYVQHYVPFEREFRVGIDYRRVLGIREKMLSDDCECKRIRNSKSCYYETRDIPKLREFAWDIAKQFGVEFTGIDIGLWKDRFIVIELNSSPAIGEYWARLLAEDLILRMRENAR